MDLGKIIAKQLATSSLEENFCPSNLDNVLFTIAKKLPQESKEFQELQTIRNLLNIIYQIPMDKRLDYLKKLDLSLISPLIDVIGNDLLLAAISHAKWLTSGDYTSCVAALEKYVKIVGIVEEKQIGEFYLLNTMKYLLEASKLAKSIKNEDLKTQIKNIALNLLKKYLHKTECLFQLWMIEIILSIDKKYGNNFIQTLWKIIDSHIDSNSKPKYVKHYYVQLIKILQQDINTDEIRKAKIKIANYYLEYIDKAIQNDIDNFSLIDEYLQDAKKIYSEFNEHARKKKCENLISQTRQHFLKNNMKEIKVEYTIPDSIVSVEPIINKVEGKKIADWFVEFVNADIFKFLPIDAYMAECNEVKYDSLTRISNLEVNLYENDKITDVTDTQTMLLNYYMLYNVHIPKYISFNSYKNAIQDSFSSDEIASILHYIAYQNDLVTQEYREQVFTALYYGWFDEDSILSTNLIGPLFEAILRQIVKDGGNYSLKGKRGNTSAQNDLTLEDLCRDHRATIIDSKLINTDVFENIEYLMIKPGFKLRHRAAHGLFSDEDYSQHYHKIAWFLFLQFLLCPLVYHTCADNKQ